MECHSPDDVAPDEEEQINPADIRFAAMNLLARREHSLRELRQKLKKRFPDEAILDTELQRLVEENLQSDERFAESFVRQRANRGYGPLRIRQEMRERGLSDRAISQAMEDADLDWFNIAAEVFQKKFGDHPAADIKQVAKRSRFMQYRGFSGDHYQYLLGRH